MGSPTTKVAELRCSIVAEQASTGSVDIVSHSGCWLRLSLFIAVMDKRVGMLTRISAAGDSSGP